MPRRQERFARQPDGRETVVPTDLQDELKDTGVEVQVIVTVGVVQP